MAEYSTHHQAWKCWKNALGSRFRGANGFYASYGFAFLFYTLSTVNAPPQEPDDFLATPKTLGRFLRPHYSKLYM